MQAIIKTGGKQYIVQPGQVIEVELLSPSQQKIDFETLLTIDGDKVAVGTPVVKDVIVKAEMVGEVKGDKLKVMKFKAKKRQKTLTGHRQRYSQVKIVSIG